MVQLRRAADLLRGSQRRRAFHLLHLARQRRTGIREWALRHWVRGRLSTAWGSWLGRASELRLLSVGMAQMQVLEELLPHCTAG